MLHFAGNLFWIWQVGLRGLSVCVLKHQWCQLPLKKKKNTEILIGIDSEQQLGHWSKFPPLVETIIILLHASSTILLILYFFESLFHIVKALFLSLSLSICTAVLFSKCQHIFAIILTDCLLWIEAFREWSSYWIDKSLIIISIQFNQYQWFQNWLNINKANILKTHTIWQIQKDSNFCLKLRIIVLLLSII